MKTIWTRPASVFFLAFFCCALWGSAAPFIKFGYTLFSIETNAIDQILMFAGFRFSLAGVLVIAIGSVVCRRPLVPRKEDWIPIGVLAFFQTAGQYFFYYIGVAHASGVSAALITGTGAFISLLVAALIFRYEKMTVYKSVGCLLGFLGIWVLNGMRWDVGFAWLGEGLILISQFFSAFSAAFIKKYSQSRNAMLLSGYQFLCGGLLLWSGGRCLGESPIPQASWKGWLVLLYLALVSALAYSIWSYLLKYNKMSKIGMYQCWIPLVGVIWSAVLLQEGSQAFSSFTLFALVLIILGIGCVNKEETS